MRNPGCVPLRIALYEARRVKTSTIMQSPVGVPSSVHAACSIFEVFMDREENSF